MEDKVNGQQQPPQNLSNWRPEDREFVLGEQEKVSNIAELSRTIDQLNNEGYGRAIVISSRQGSSEKKEETVGYILPSSTDPEKPRSLIVMKNGSIIVVQPRDDGKETTNKYQSAFSPNEASLTFFDTDMPSIINELSNSIYNYQSKVLFSNANQNHLSDLSAEMDQAISLAETLKQQREQTRLESVKNFLGKINSSIFGNSRQQSSIEKPPSQEPPQNPPDSSPPPLLPA